MQSMRCFVAAAALWLGMSLTVQAATLVSTDVYSSDEAFADCAINNIGSHDVTLTAHAIQLFSGVSQTLLPLAFDGCNGQVLQAGHLCFVVAHTAAAGVTCKAQLPGSSRHYRARVELRNSGQQTLVHDDLRGTGDPEGDD